MVNKNIVIHKVMKEKKTDLLKKLKKKLLFVGKKIFICPKMLQIGLYLVQGT